MANEEKFSHLIIGDSVSPANLQYALNKGLSPANLQTALSPAKAPVAQNSGSQSTPKSDGG
jgi:hypothetical protein